MTQPDQRYSALRSARRLLEELCDPGKTPRVPAIVRERARTALRHYPTELDVEKLVTACPEVIDRQDAAEYTKHIKVVNQR